MACVDKVPIFCFFPEFFSWICVAVRRVVCLFHGANRCIPWRPFISRVLFFFGVFFAFHRFFFGGFERFCFVLAVFGRVSCDLHTCDH